MDDNLIQVTVIDRDGTENILEVPTDINLSLMEILRHPTMKYWPLAVVWRCALPAMSKLSKDCIHFPKRVIKNSTCWTRFRMPMIKVDLPVSCIYTITTTA